VSQVGDGEFAIDLNGSYASRMRNEVEKAARAFGRRRPPHDRLNLAASAVA